MCNRTPPSPSLQRLPHGTLLQPQSCPTCPHFPQLDRVGANYTAAAWQQLCRTVVQKSRCPKRESLSVAMLQLWMQRQLSVVRVFVASKALHSHFMCVCVHLLFSCLQQMPTTALLLHSPLQIWTLAAIWCECTHICCNTKMCARHPIYAEWESARLHMRRYSLHCIHATFLFCDSVFYTVNILWVHGRHLLSTFRTGHASQSSECVARNRTVGKTR